MTELFQAMGQMDNMTIGLWITSLMLVLVILGLRVAFAAAVAGFMGLVWIFSAKLGFEKGFIVAAKMAGTIPHSKVSSVALSLIPTFILIGFLAYHAGLTKALFEAAKRWVGWLPGGMGVATVFFNSWLCCRIRRFSCDLSCVCAHSRARDAQAWV